MAYSFKNLSAEEISEKRKYILEKRKNIYNVNKDILNLERRTRRINETEQEKTERLNSVNIYNKNKRANIPAEKKAKNLEKRRQRYSERKDIINTGRKEKINNLTDEQKELLAEKRRQKYHSNIEHARLVKNTNSAKPKCKERRKAYYYILKTKYDYNLKHSLRRRLSTKLAKNEKYISAIRDIGCTIEELRIYLEKQFQPGMSWQNHSFNGWHIDHIRPIGMFDLRCPAQQYYACHYTNLRPLWAKENASKAAEDKRIIKFVRKEFEKQMTEMDDIIPRNRKLTNNKAGMDYNEE